MTAPWRPKRSRLPAIEELRAAFIYYPAVGVLVRRSTGRVAGSPDRWGHLVVRYRGRRLRAHRIAWAIHHGEDPAPFDVLHINKDGRDNRLKNLCLGRRGSNLKKG